MAGTNEAGGLVRISGQNENTFRRSPQKSTKNTPRLLCTVGDAVTETKCFMIIFSDAWKMAEMLGSVSQNREGLFEH
jgi:hypothetical protein